MQHVWVTIRLPEHSNERVEQIRDTLRDAIPEGFTEETDPHISLLPGVRLPETQLSAFRNSVLEAADALSELSVAGLDTYPQSNPMVVLLQIETSLEAIRSQLLSELDSLGGEVVYPPQDSHLTLFKGGDGSAADWTIDEQQAEAIHTAIEAAQTQKALETTWVDTTFEITVESFEPE